MADKKTIEFLDRVLPTYGLKALLVGVLEQYKNEILAGTPLGIALHNDICDAKVTQWAVDMLSPSDTDAEVIRIKQECYIAGAIRMREEIGRIMNPKEEGIRHLTTFNHIEVYFDPNMDDKTMHGHWREGKPDFLVTGCRSVPEAKKMAKGYFLDLRADLKDYYD